MGSSYAATDNGIGMVLDVKGKAKATYADKSSRELKSMEPLVVGQTIETQKGAVVALVLFSNNAEYEIASSSKAVISKNGIKALSGKVKQKNSKVALNLPKNASVPSRKLLGNLVRNLDDFLVDLQNPVDGGNCLSNGTIFSWYLQGPPPSTTFTLLKVKDEKDPSKNEKIFETTLKGYSLKYPPKGAPKLENGKKYQVIIQGNFPKEDKSLISKTSKIDRQFTVLSKEDESSIIKFKNYAFESMRKDPSDLTPLKKLMIIYLTNQLYMDAVNTGLLLEQKMPDNKDLALYMYYSYNNMGMISKAKEYKKKASESKIN
jgi:hypothetical protein